jgi:hypothetical protein
LTFYNPQVATSDTPSVNDTDNHSKPRPAERPWNRPAAGSASAGERRLDRRPGQGLGNPVGYHGVQHAQRVPIHPVGHQQPTRGDQGRLAGPGDAARLTESGQVDRVAPLEDLLNTPQRPVRARRHPLEAEPPILAISSNCLAATRSGLSAVIAAGPGHPHEARPQNGCRTGFMPGHPISLACHSCQLRHSWMVRVWDVMALLTLLWVTVHDRPGSGGQRPPRVRSAMAISESGLW